MYVRTYVYVYVHMYICMCVCVCCVLCVCVCVCVLNLTDVTQLTSLFTVDILSIYLYHYFSS